MFLTCAEGVCLERVAGTEESRGMQRNTKLERSYDSAVPGKVLGPLHTSLIILISGELSIAASIACRRKARLREVI